MAPLRSISAAALAAGVLLALSACGSSTPSLPSFPDYPPARAYLAEQERLREQVNAQEAYQARVRMANRVAAAQRAQVMWQRSEAELAELEREQAFRDSIRRRNEQRHFEELREYQSYALQ